MKKKENGTGELIVMFALLVAIGFSIHSIAKKLNEKLDTSAYAKK